MHPRLILLLLPFKINTFALQLTHFPGDGKAYRIYDKKERIFEASINEKNFLDRIVIDLIFRRQYEVTIRFDEFGNLEQFFPRKFDTSKPLVGVPLGINMFFHKTGKIAQRHISSGVDDNNGLNAPCEWQFFYDESGKLTEKVFHERKCQYGKGLITFFLPPGEYYVTEPPLRLRAEPSLKGKIIGNLAKDEKVEVLDFTKERLEINGFYAPWAKVKTAKGEGWVYGGYIEPVNYGETYKKYFQNIDWQKFVEKMGLE